MPAMSEEYVSKTFPSDQFLIGKIKGWISEGYVSGLPRGAEFVKLLGKNQEPDGSYNLYYNIRFQGKLRLYKVNLIKLDSGIWLVTLIGMDQYVLEK
jgi:hypothetical protein